MNSRALHTCSVRSQLQYHLLREAFPDHLQKPFHFILRYFLPITAHHLKGPHLFVCSLSLPQWNVHPRTAGADPILFAAVSPEPGTVLNEYTDEFE